MKQLWANQKYKDKFVSSYERDAKGEREFVLTATVKSRNGKYRRISHESWQAARFMGWKKAGWKRG